MSDERAPSVKWEALSPLLSRPVAEGVTRQPSAPPLPDYAPLIRPTNL